MLESNRKFREESYTIVGKNYNPKEGEILYRFDEYLDIPPLGVKIIKWGSENHGEDHNFIIQSENIYQQEILDKWKKDMKRREFKKLMKEENKRKSWFFLPELYKKN